MKSIISFLFLISSITTYAQYDSQIQDGSMELESSGPFNVVEQMPEFPGGEDALIAYLQKNIKYPTKAMDSNLQGTVNVLVVINEDGSVSNSKVLTSFDSGCSQEALRVIREMPNWRPGRQNGKPVKVFYTVPIIFSLK